MASRPFYRRRGFRGGYRGGYHSSYHHYYQLKQQQLQQAKEQAEAEKPAPIPLDPVLLYGEDFKSRSQKRRILIAKALGVRHPDLLHFCLHTPREIVKLRAKSNSYQASLLSRRRSKLAKMKAKEAKRRLASKASQPAAVPTPVQESAADEQSANKPSVKSDPSGSQNAEGDGEGKKPVEAATAAKLEEVDKTGPNDDNNVDDVEPPMAQSSLSGGPQNDYSFHFICTGERPANFVRDIGLANRFEEYPKLRDLIRAKDNLIQVTNPPSFCLQTDLATFSLPDLGCEFDCVLIEPPLEDYRYMGQVFDKYWNWDEIEKLDVGSITAGRSFVWLWVGAGEGLDRGRRCLSKWGFRRCEDIVWVKTNANHQGHSSLIEPKSLFQRTKEHCLMGIKGTVLRSKDGDFIHANIDLDVIIDEEPEPGVKDKPVEMFHIIEHFCLGRRRLHLFARESTIRPGWLSIGSELVRSNFDAEEYRKSIETEPGMTTGCTEEIERMRPKTPPAVKAAVAAQQAQAASAATGPPVVLPSASGIIQPSPLPPGMIAQSIGAALLQQHCESPNVTL